MSYHVISYYITLAGIQAFCVALKYSTSSPTTGVPLAPAGAWAPNDNNDNNKNNNNNNKYSITSLSVSISISIIVILLAPVPGSEPRLCVSPSGASLPQAPAPQLLNHDISEAPGPRGGAPGAAPSRGPLPPTFLPRANA